jgi:cation:H+ antiporter
MFDFSGWSLTLAVSVFLISAVVIAVFGSMMTRIADRLADLTGLGEAIVGAVFLGGSTSLPGITTSVTAAAGGYAELAISNAIGGIAAQTVFLAIADIAYRKANLEHAAASITNIMQGALLIALLSIIVIAVAGPQVTIFNIHPASILLLAGYLFGLRLISRSQSDPMWKPRKTKETFVDDIQYEKQKLKNLVLFWTKFFLLAIIVGFAGYIVAKTGVVISSRAGISATIVGGMFTAIATSLPELVTSVAAVRQGALTLAVGGVIGGNCFDILFAAFSDFAYREGSIYAALSDQQLLMIALTILLTGILILGLLHREKHGIANIGFESFLIIVFYLMTFTFLALS